MSDQRQPKPPARPSQGHSSLPDAKNAGLPPKPPPALDSMNTIKINPRSKPYGPKKGLQGKESKSLESQVSNTGEASSRSLSHNIPKIPWGSDMRGGIAGNALMNSAATFPQTSHIPNIMDMAIANRYTSYSTTNPSPSSNYDYNKNYITNYNTNYNKNYNTNYYTNYNTNYNVHNKNPSNLQSPGTNKRRQNRPSESAAQLTQRELDKLHQQLVNGKTRLTPWDQKYIVSHLESNIVSISSYMMSLVVTQITNKTGYLSRAITRWALRKQHDELLKEAATNELFNFDAEEAFKEGLMSVEEVSELMDFLDLVLSGSSKGPAEQGQRPESARANTDSDQRDSYSTSTTTDLANSGK
ncbi:hypothetical protein GGS21DRAFT_209238 [Xylaria nigripes]|nr:hypothetical protein GGS21DRAFT_209238 [Xylaria nigripes]